MKRFYSISKPQLLTLWAFGGIATLWAIDKASYLPFSSSFTFTEFVGWFVPLALFLYTFGWRDHHKNK
ncbi:MAG: hypothetical protein QG636_495 [Patescibacteria group bacterium]|jgi:hypothetical protein|nr:hypothetical protein [Patescibacteria group bacterium]